MALPNQDPSNPALPAPIFSDVDAVRGDHLRANNNLIWGNLQYLDDNTPLVASDTETGDGELDDVYVSPLKLKNFTDFTRKPRLVAKTNLPSSDNWGSICTSSLRVVAVAYNTSKAAVSIDGGITWTAGTMPSVANWIQVNTAEGAFFSVAFNTNKAATSGDGITWTARTLPATANWNSVAGGFIGGNSVRVAVAQGTSSAAYSLDGGGTWSSSSMPVSADWSAVEFGNGRFFAVAKTGATAAVSTDGINWSSVSVPFLLQNASLKKMVYVDGRFLFFGSDPFDAQYYGVLEDGSTTIQVVQNPEFFGLATGGAYKNYTIFVPYTYGAARFVGSVGTPDTSIPFSPNFSTYCDLTITRDRCIIIGNGSISYVIDFYVAF